MADHGLDWQLPPRVVAAAVDFEPASARAAALAGAIAAAADAALHVVHAERFDVPPYFTKEQVAALDEERRAASRELETELGRLVASATRQPAKVTVAEGPPVETILTQTTAADLLVLGTHGRRGPSRWWLGSVAERVVRGAHVPVLVTRDDQGPPAAVFARIVIVGDGETPDPRSYAAVSALAAALGGHVTLRAPLQAFDGRVLDAATLVAVVMPMARSRWGLSDVVTDVLGRCDRPVLFMPAR